VLLSKRIWDKLDQQQQTALLDISRRKLHELTELTRRDNRKALAEMEAAGVEMLPPPPPESMTEYIELGERVRRELAGKIYSPEWLNRIESALQEYRQQGN
jgi:TRAP-type C4-dicarboxylate transport system substrate-binding protein